MKFWKNLRRTGKSYVCLILAKKDSSRLPGKNTLDFRGEPMFLYNVRKCLKIFKYVYVSSDDLDILNLAYSVGAIPVLRGKSLCGDVPNIPVYQHALQFMAKPKGVIAVQANSPTVCECIIKEVLGRLKIYDEVMTVNADGSIYGSVWGIKTNKLVKYGDPYNPKPSYVIYDPSTDIHTIEDYNKALYE